MPTSVTIVVALSVLLGFLVIIQGWMGTDDVDDPKIRWQLDGGSGAYLDMLDRLWNLAETPADGDGSRSPLAAFAGVVTEKPAFFAMVRYDTPPAERRSSRSSWASCCTGPAAGSTGGSGRPIDESSSALTKNRLISGPRYSGPFR
ncbi:hypothetical protein PWE32_12705 [Streptomyces neyagawaensis]|nr:hypothetical protein [Streptomyces neyagawaensis]MCL6731609.1 hypothetical protein [Streptomyces neyagawaensis]MDE1683165.1 hypothetical protein [Streptomyces neyagawaensis]